MRWSKLRQLVRETFASSVRDRVDIHSAAYGACSCGHAWLTLDGKVVANFCTRANGIANYLPDDPKVGTTPRHQFVEWGELSRQDAYQACWEFVHNLSIEQALSDSDPLVQTLAVLDARVGKRKLAQLQQERFHRLAGVLLVVRKEAEGIQRSNVIPLKPETAAAELR